jgi:hypothetical protein
MNNFYYLAEFLGTVFFSFMVFFSLHNYLVIGLTLSFLILINSKGAYNPGIAFMSYNTGKLSLIEFIIYVILELLGFYTGYEIYKRFVSK